MTTARRSGQLGITPRQTDRLMELMHVTMKALDPLDTERVRTPFLGETNRDEAIRIPIKKKKPGAFLVLSLIEYEKLLRKL